MDMASSEADALRSTVASLGKSFERLPPVAVPPFVDCVLASTGLSPALLFPPLLDAFFHSLEEADEGISSSSSKFISFLIALCHLLKNPEIQPDALPAFIWKGFLPLLGKLNCNDFELLSQIADLLCDVVIDTHASEVVEATIIPFFLRLAGLSIGMLQNEELAMYQWRKITISQDPESALPSCNLYKEVIFPTSLSFPMSITCHILTSILLAAIKRCQILNPVQEKVVALDGFPENIAKKMLWDLSHMVLRMLCQSLECRSWATRFLLPSVLWAFGAVPVFEISMNGEKFVFSRDCFFRKIWNHCGALASLGPLERQDVFNVLSLCSPLFSLIEDHESSFARDGMEKFDIREEEKLWEIVRNGLVDKDAHLRKQSLHILKLLVGQQSKGSEVQLVSNSETKNDEASHGATKRGKWAEKEAKSLGVGKICNFPNSSLNSHQRWEAFILLYEMLNEFGTHLVEAAWTHQISLLLSLSLPHNISASIVGERVYELQMGTLAGVFSWLAVLWERSFCHDNPQVRCLIMQSFLGVDWENLEAKLVPGSFVLGPFLQGLNDPVHHKDFGLKGIYSSKTIEDASKFFLYFSRGFSRGERVAFLTDLASAAKHDSFGRVGLMALAVCIASASGGALICCGVEVLPDKSSQCFESAGEDNLHSYAALVDTLRIVIERSKHHFNPKYRLRVCEQVVEVATSVVSAYDVPFDLLLHFVSALPREFTDIGGNLRVKLQKWLGNSKSTSSESSVLNSIHDFAENFIKDHRPIGTSAYYDDEDLDAWASEANRWARLLFLLVTNECHLESLFAFIKSCGFNICTKGLNTDWAPVKFLLLVLSMVQEIQIVSNKFSPYADQFRKEVNVCTTVKGDLFDYQSSSALLENFTEPFLLILDELVSFAELSCSVFWSQPALSNGDLPCSVRGKLGGRSQRRLAPSVTTAALQATLSMKTVACVTSWCEQCKSSISFASVHDFLWNFCSKVTSTPAYDSETGAEIYLAAYEALVPVLRAFCCSFSPVSYNLVMTYTKKSALLKADGGPVLDPFVLQFLKNINDLLALGVLARSRKAILMDCKWLCLDSLLSIPYLVIESGVQLGSVFPLFSDSVLQHVYAELVESLENAGERSVLPMLRSIRLVIDLLCSKATPSCYINAEMMWHLVRSCWVLHVNCNKRRVAPIAALLSSVLHSSLFNDINMHEKAGGQPGPMKWFIEMILDEGIKSPRTIRLAALHLTGLWLSYPKMIKYYIKELKLLSLYGSVAFDEDFEAELTENHEARKEVLLLSQTPETELSEAYINTEMYARIAVAVMCSKLADLADTLQVAKQDADALSAKHSGKLFLLELLDSVVNDKDLSKELYKKYSAIHRRKVRAWQMICVLSRFVHDDIVQQVTEMLHICLYRNNLPAVRQYLETFAIQVYLKFPKLIGEQLIPVFNDYNMRPQALSSYVFIAANVILHATQKPVQLKHLYELLPPMVPFLTSHHHSLRGFTQLLVYEVLSKLVDLLDPSISENASLESKCFMDLKCYLTENPDCKRLRMSMHGFLDRFDPNIYATPAGIFTAENEEVDFECVPTSLMEQVINFLNDVREDLRYSMAKDVITIQNENLTAGETVKDTAPLMEIVDGGSVQHLKEVPVDFQKKITLYKHERQDRDANNYGDSGKFHGALLESFIWMEETEKEDLLLSSLVYNRSIAIERMKESRQSFILVASLLERIPNLAGLARTCEVFKAASLALADASIVHDKQFQLISVTAEKWVPIIEVPVASIKFFLEKKKREGFSLLGLEQTANSTPLDVYSFPTKTVLVLGREKEGIPVDLIHILDACIEIPQLGVVRSLNVHVSGAIALWEYTRQQRSVRR